MLLIELINGQRIKCEDSLEFFLEQMDNDKSYVVVKEEQHCQNLGTKEWESIYETAYLSKSFIVIWQEY